MATTKEVQIRKVVFGSEHPAALCSSLIGATTSQLVEEAKMILQKKPDVLEWRADFFADLAKLDAVLATATSLREVIGDTVLLFTIRSVQEGGQPISLTIAEQEELISRLIETELIDLLDIELASEFIGMDLLKQLSAKHHVKWIVSTHDFKKTPSFDQMIEFLQAGQAAGADLVKLAVMPQSSQDVLTLLSVTNEASAKLDIPVITMSMGKLGVSTRLIGDQFGSAMTFAVGHQASAPGQVPIEVIKDIQHYTS
ncbi:type I 3-dehydroquinate dehydratase [Alkalicoccobacillus plakortidis]|uniref:3-dehydroquinate dehydratase n=1 Tax=Alkalicoccobacillus plakortidis TaxID=444060 RepID=A0ABT0XGF1_9BACI|nr:type I 3-dehydroquinate dehydratase [Alkalicoccobacillus plakortidis]MCM2674986.1 type I 3-dehydroquinate dehydratase [Alkalicoccobacillus plakortidis]